MKREFHWETQVYSQALGVCQDDIARVDSLCLVLTVAMAPMPFAAPFLLEGPESCPCYLPVCARDARAYVYSHRRGFSLQLGAVSVKTNMHMYIPRSNVYISHDTTTTQIPSSPDFRAVLL